MPHKKFLKPLLCGFFLFIIFGSIQAKAFRKGFYSVTFTDKACSEYSLSSAKQYLTDESRERRDKFGISLDSTDLPVSQVYIDQIESLGLTYSMQSKWLNAGLFYAADSLTIPTIITLPFVDTVEWLAPVRTPDLPQSLSAALKDVAFSEITGDVASQIKFTSMEFFRERNIDASGTHIAVLDAGFMGGDVSETFAHIPALYTKNLTNTSAPVYSNSRHGTAVWSLMGGHSPDLHFAAATGADYSLIVSEVPEYEYLIEEFYWVVGMEFTDSIGADIVNSSLGYSTFDAEEQNHQKEELDGKTTMVAKAAKLAWQKGIFVINSAGNKGDDEWKNIITPADTEEILTVGSSALDSSVSDFSSIGFDNKHYIKPEVTCLGENPFGDYGKGSVTQMGIGTSYSAPIITGGIACLKQAFPLVTNDAIKQTVIKSCNNTVSPNTRQGYGIPNFRSAYYSLLYNDAKPEKELLIFPNPAKDFLFLTYPGMAHRRVDMEIYTQDGALIWKDSLIETGGIESYKFDIQSIGMGAGVYFMFITSEKERWMERFMIYN